jgi:hypothetical protein
MAGRRAGRLAMAAVGCGEAVPREAGQLSRELGGGRIVIVARRSCRLRTAAGECDREGATRRGRLLRPAEAERMGIATRLGVLLGEAARRCCWASRSRRGLVAVLLLDAGDGSWLVLWSWRRLRLIATYRLVPGRRRGRSCGLGPAGADRRTVGRDLCRAGGGIGSRGGARDWS